MIILGIDPGTTAVGYALVENPRAPRALASGLLTIRADSATERLKELHQELGSLIRKWKPEVLAVEKVFFSRNVKTALEVSQARGVILLTSSLAGLRVYEYTPLEVKKIITGDGNADKMQIKKMVQLTLKEMSEVSARDDVFDAIAIALTYCFRERHLIRES